MKTKNIFFVFVLLFITVKISSQEFQSIEELKRRFFEKVF